MREVVKIWLGTHARNIDWKILVLGSGKRNNRVSMKATAIAHENAARYMRTWVDNQSDSDAADRAARAIDALPNDQNVAGVPDLSPDPDKVTADMVYEAAVLAGKCTADAGPSTRQNDLVKCIMLHADECARVARDIEKWLKDNPAEGGTNLAAREVAALLAHFINDARDAAATLGISCVDLPKVAFADGDNHEPRNLYCAMVKATLEVLSLDPKGWRYAAMAVCPGHRVIGL
ncbi:MAG: hypothetical protein COB65_04775 [Thalassobium sp.]|nr:MAG: hypothetical protein COB65_04775 [Thalassobium sp.]